MPVHTGASTLAAFRYSLPVLKIYNTRYVHYSFSVLTVNTETHFPIYRCIYRRIEWTVIAVEEVESRVEREADNSMNIPSLFTKV